MGHDESTRQLSLDEAVALANQLQRDKRLDEADALYRAVLEVAPQHADTLHFSGVLAPVSYTHLTLPTILRV